MTPAGPVLCLVLQDLDSESCGTEVNYIISFAVFAEFNPEPRLKYYFHTQPRERRVLDVVAYSDDSAFASLFIPTSSQRWVLDALAYAPEALDSFLYTMTDRL